MNQAALLDVDQVALLLDLDRRVRMLEKERAAPVTIFVERAQRAPREINPGDHHEYDDRGFRIRW